MLSMIVASTLIGAIGYKGDMLYHIPEDLKYFKSVTLGHKVIVGRKTFDSIPNKLPGRFKYVISRNKYRYRGTEEGRSNDYEIITNPESLIEKYKDSEEEVFVIGGAEIYKQFRPYCTKVYQTLIIDDKVKPADTFIDPIFPNDEEWEIVDYPLQYDKYYKYIKSGVVPYIHIVYKRKEEKKEMNKLKRHEELCKKIHDTYIAKNNDYGNSVTELFEKLGPVTVATRLGDKYNRICSLISKGLDQQKVKSESILDTFLDLANYAIIGYLEMEDYLKKDNLNNITPDCTGQQPYTNDEVKEICNVGEKQETGCSKCKGGSVSSDISEEVVTDCGKNYIFKIPKLEPGSTVNYCLYDDKVLLKEISFIIDNNNKPHELSKAQYSQIESLKENAYNPKSGDNELVL